MDWHNAIPLYGREDQAVTGPSMGWLEATVLGYAKAFSMRGRASRAEYWKFWAMSYVLMFVITIAMVMTGAEGGIQWTTRIIALGAFISLTNVALWTAAVRRLHERGSSAWWTLPHPIMIVSAAVGWWELAWLDPRIIEVMTQPPPEMVLLSGASAVYGLAELAWIPGFILLMLR